MMETKITEESDGKSSDIICHLPDDLIHVILTCMPLRDAARTSILSREWRYKWTFIPKLTLDHTLLKETKENKPAPRVNFAVILNQLLSLLEGPIIECKVSIPDVKDCPEIYNLVKQVKYLEVELPKREKYKLPSSVFTCSQLRVLALHHCSINAPPTFEQFRYLIDLDFSKVTISVKSLENLISCCPLLENLALVISEPLNHLEVNAPQLRYFYFGSKVNSLCFKNTTLLDSVLITIRHDLDQRSSVQGDGDKKRKKNRSKHGKCNFFEFFGSLPAVKELCLGHSIIKSLITGLDEIPERLPMLLPCLRELTLFHICLSELHEVCYLLCMLKSSPYLEEIYIEIEFEGCLERGYELLAEVFLKAEIYSDMQLNHLTKISLLGISGKKPEIKLIKLLLAKSPVLEKLLIELCLERVSARKWSYTTKKVTKFGRAAPQTEIIFQDGDAKRV